MPGFDALTFYADLDVYRDRVRMLQHVAARVGHVVLLTAAPPREDFATAHLEVVPLAARRLPRPLVQALLWRTARQLLKARPIRLVHDTQAYLLPLFAALRGRRRDFVLLTSTFTASYDWFTEVRQRWPYSAPGYARLRWQGHAEEWAQVRLADAVTVFGEGHRTPLARCYGLSEARVFSVPNCADPDFFAPVAADPALLGFGLEARVLLYTGNVFRYKGTYELLEALAAVAPAHPDVRLLIVGYVHPAENVLLAAAVSRLGLSDRVRLVGQVPRAKIPALLSSAFAYVFPSYFEGSPRAVIEAMACARPIVASRLPGITQLDPQEQFIRFVPRADAPALACALDALLSAPSEDAASRGAAARARFLSHHTPQAAAVPLADLWTRLVAARPARGSAP